MYKRVPFYGRRSGGVIGRRYAPRSRVRLGNVDDSINTPGFPGSSTYYGRLSAAETVAPAPSFFEKAGQFVTSFAQTAVPAYLQLKIAKANISRAKQGLAPIDPSTIAPAMRVEVAPSGETLRTAGLGAGAIALALAGIAAVMLLRRR
jgi:hypothetical protein